MKSRKVLFALMLALVLCLMGSVAMAATKNVTPETAQAALDAAVSGDVIVLGSGDYGTLYIRQTDTSTEVWTGHGGGALGTYTHGRLRSINGLTIKSTEDAQVSQIVIETNKYGGTTSHSNSATNPHLDSYISINNLVVDGISFDLNNNVAIGTGIQTAINGLTIQNCVVNGSGSGNVERLLYVPGENRVCPDLKGDTIITTGINNVQILNNEVSDVHQVLEMHQVNNIKISGNTFENVRARDILLNGAISGDIEISSNTSNGSGDVFVRLYGVDGNVTLKSNTITNCVGSDGNFVKMSNLSPNTVVNVIDCTYNGVEVYPVIVNGALVMTIPDEIPVVPNPPIPYSAPKTGDSSNIALWLSLMAISAAAFVVLSKKARFN